MWKHLAAVLLLLLLSIQKSSYGLKCNNMNPEPPPEWNEIDCPSNDTKINDGEVYVCFAISGQLLAGGFGGTLTCVPKGSCKNQSILALFGFKPADENSCIECEVDRCNELAATPEDKDGSTTTTTKTSAVSKISAISSVVITLIVVIVVFM